MTEQAVASCILGLPEGRFQHVNPEAAPEPEHDAVPVAAAAERR